MNGSFVHKAPIVPYEHRTPFLDHIELVVKLVPLVFIEQVDALDCHRSPTLLVDASVHVAAIATTQDWPCRNVILLNWLVSLARLHICGSIFVHLYCFLCEKYPGGRPYSERDYVKKLT